MATTAAADYLALLCTQEGMPRLMDTPQVLLDHHLKTLRLPTFLREYDKVAQQCAAEGVDFPRYLLRLRNWNCWTANGAPPSAASARRSSTWSRVWTLSTSWRIPSLNKSLVLDLARCEFIERKENVLAAG